MVVSGFRCLGVVHFIVRGRDSTREYRTWAVVCVLPKGRSPLTRTMSPMCVCALGSRVDGMSSSRWCDSCVAAAHAFHGWHTPTSYVATHGIVFEARPRCRTAQVHHSFCVGCPTTRRSFTHLRAAVLGRHLVAIGALDTDMLAVADEYNALIAWRSEGRNTSSARHRLEACEVRGGVAPPCFGSCLLPSHRACPHVGLFSLSHPAGQVPPRIQALRPLPVHP